MRTFGTLLVAAVFAFAAGCGGGSSSGTTSNVRSGSTAGQCPSTTGQSCTGGDAYAKCEMAACGAQYKTCFGNNYASNDFTGGSCATYIECLMKCPCDGSAAQTSCEAPCTAGLLSAGTCQTDILALGACVQAATQCKAPVCTTTGTNTSTSTLTNTSTVTTTLTSTLTTTTTSTTTGCAAAAACCTTLGATLGASIAQACQSSIAGLTDAECTAAVAAYKQYCP